jgi:hypothetical protein
MEEHDAMVTEPAATWLALHGCVSCVSESSHEGSLGDGRTVTETAEEVVCCRSEAVGFCGSQVVEQRGSVSQQILAVAQNRLQAQAHEEGATVTCKRSSAQVFQYSTLTARIQTAP